MSDSDVVALTRELIGLPSVNPQGHDYREPPYGESRMVSFLLEWFRSSGLDAEAIAVRPGRENVVVMAEGQDRSRGLLLTAHMDTVDVEGMSVSPFKPVVRNGRLYGRGACDDKGPMACMMLAFRERVQRGGLPCNLVFLASCSEEYDLAGSRYFAEHLPCAIQGGIFAEPTDMQVVTAHKGVTRLRVDTMGRSAHSSTPEQGHNAIYDMGRVIREVEAYAEALAGKPGETELGAETLALTMVDGGLQINMIPPWCKAMIDWRVLPGHTGPMCRDELAALLHERCGKAITVELLNEYPPMRTDPDAALVTAALRACEQTGIDSGRATKPYATDAGAFSGLAIPTPVWGPGSAAEAHTEDESIALSALEDGVAGYRALLAEDAVAWLGSV